MGQTREARRKEREDAIFTLTASLQHWELRTRRWHGFARSLQELMARFPEQSEVTRLSGVLDEILALASEADREAAQLRQKLDELRAKRV